MRITREWAMPNANTFTVKPICEFIEHDLLKIRNRNGVIVDPFANSCKFGTITNDLNPEFDTTFHLDALEFLKYLESESADMLLYDPPYSFRQASECYKSFGKENLSGTVTNMQYWKECKDECARIVKQNGIAMTFGWSSNGLGINRGFDITDILLVAHGGTQNDTICVREIKRNKTKQLSLF